MRHIDADKIDLRMPHVVDERGNILVLLSDVKQAIAMVPAADVVSKGVYEQVQWERDMAMQQLEEHGIPFCGVADDVVKVVRCKDCRFYGNEERHPYGGECEWFGALVERNNFCFYGERKEKDDGR